MCSDFLTKKSFPGIKPMNTVYDFDHATPAPPPLSFHSLHKVCFLYFEGNLSGHPLLLPELGGARGRQAAGSEELDEERHLQGARRQLQVPAQPPEGHLRRQPGRLRQGRGFDSQRSQRHPYYTSA